MERFWKIIEFIGLFLAGNILWLLSGVSCLVTGNLLLNWLEGGSGDLLLWSVGLTEVMICVIIKAVKPEKISRENGGGE